MSYENKEALINVTPNGCQLRLGCNKWGCGHSLEVNNVPSDENKCLKGSDMEGDVAGFKDFISNEKTRLFPSAKVLKSGVALKRNREKLRSGCSFSIVWR